MNQYLKDKFEDTEFWFGAVERALKDPNNNSDLLVVKERLERRRALVEDAIARIRKGETVTTVLHRDEEVELNNCIKEALVRNGLEFILEGLNSFTAPLYPKQKQGKDE